MVLLPSKVICRCTQFLMATAVANCKIRAVTEFNYGNCCVCVCVSVILFLELVFFFQSIGLCFFVSDNYTRLRMFKFRRVFS